MDNEERSKIYGTIGGALLGSGILYAAADHYGMQDLYTPTIVGAIMGGLQGNTVGTIGYRLLNGNNI